MSRFGIYDLASIIKERASADADISYTRKLLDKGSAHCARKMGEEAVETIIATLDGDREQFVGECADLIYHFLVLLEAKKVALSDVEEELSKRTKQSGLDEKAARAKD